MELNTGPCAIYDAAARHEFALLLYGHCPKSQGMKQLMAGGGIALVGIALIPLLSGLFG